MSSQQAKAYSFGSAGDEGSVLQPVCSQQSLDRLVGYVDDAVAKGARKICGGAKADREGFFLEATILADTTKDMKCSCEEIFGSMTPQSCSTVHPHATCMLDNTDGGVYTGMPPVVTRAIHQLPCESGTCHGALRTLMSVR